LRQRSIVSATPGRSRVLARGASWILAAAVAALVAATEGPRIVATLRPPPPESHDNALHDTNALQRAAALRDQAFAAVAVGQRAGVRQKLDEARALDPAGDSDPPVQEARRALDGPGAPRAQ
jgi:hypothetical protein